MRCTLLLLTLSAAPLVAQESSLISFELEDQFERVHRDTDYTDRILVVIGSDRDGSEFNQAWGEALDSALADEPGSDRVAFLPVADLTGVPFFIKGMVRGRFPEERDRFALMDWDGVFDEAYSFVPGSTNVLLFATGRELLQHVHGQEPDPEVLQSIVFTIRLLLADQG